MKVEYINPFVESVEELFTKMLDSSATHGAPGVTRAELNPNDITAVIQMTGRANGMVALSLPRNVALAMVNRLLHADSHVIDSSVTDGVSELVNMIAGQAKAKFPTDDGLPIDLGLPAVTRGSNYNIDYPSNTVWIEIPFQSELGSFTLRVTFKMNGK